MGHGHEVEATAVKADRSDEVLPVTKVAGADPAHGAARRALG